MAIRFAEQKNTMNPVKPELGASSLFGDVSSHVNQVPVEKGGKATVKEVIRRIDVRARYHFRLLGSSISQELTT